MAERRCPTTAQVQAMIDAGGGGLTFTELAGGQNKVVTTASTWGVWDLSAIVPAGAVAVLVAIGATTTRQLAGARKNGSALVRSAQTPDVAAASVDSWTTTILTECDVNRIIEIFCASTALMFNILGYWS